MLVLWIASSLAPRDDEESARHALPLPVADAARLAGPDLHASVEGLRIEWIAMVTGELRSSDNARRLRLPTGKRGGANGGNTGGMNNDLRLDPGLGRGFCTGLRALAAAIDGHIKRPRREASGRPKRLRRKHRCGKVQAKELDGAVFVRERQTAPRQHGRANDSAENVPRDHEGLLKCANKQ